MYAKFATFLNKFDWQLNIPESNTLTTDDILQDILTGVDTRTDEIDTNTNTNNTNTNKISLYKKYSISYELAGFMNMVPGNCTVSVADVIKYIQYYLESNKMSYSKRLFTIDRPIARLLGVPESVTEVRWNTVPAAVIDRHFNIYTMIVINSSMRTRYMFVPHYLFTEKLRTLAQTSLEFPFRSPNIPNGIDPNDHNIFTFVVEHYNSKIGLKFPENVSVDSIYTYF